MLSLFLGSTSTLGTRFIGFFEITPSSVAVEKIFDKRNYNNLQRTKVLYWFLLFSLYFYKKRDKKFAFGKTHSPKYKILSSKTH